MQSPATNRAATQQLPAGYTPQRVFALNSTRVQVLMNLAGLVLLIGAGLLFVTLFRVLRPEVLGPALSVQVGEIGDLARVLAVTALVLVLSSAKKTLLRAQPKGCQGGGGGHALFSRPAHKPQDAQQRADAQGNQVIVRMRGGEEELNVRHPRILPC